MPALVRLAKTALPLSNKHTIGNPDHPLAAASGAVFQHWLGTTPVLPQASADDKFADYKPTTAFFFPGQGAQSVGMAKVGSQPS